MPTLSLAEHSAKLMDVQSVAEMCGCSVRHVYRLSGAGWMLRLVKLVALVRWSKLAIEKWITDGCPQCRKAKGGTK